jgi:hypothetical protein
MNDDFSKKKYYKNFPISLQKAKSKKSENTKFFLRGFSLFLKIFKRKNFPRLLSEKIFLFNDGRFSSSFFD